MAALRCFGIASRSAGGSCFFAAVAEGAEFVLSGKGRSAFGIRRWGLLFSGRLLAVGKL